MPTYNLSLTTGNYPNVGGTTSSNPALILAGSEVTINLSMANASNFSGTLGVSLVLNTHAGTFYNQPFTNGVKTHTFTAPSATYAGNNLQRMSFFCMLNGAVIGSQPTATLESGGFHWQVYAAPAQSHGSVTGVSADNTASETPTITVSSSGTTGTVQVGYSSTSTGAITWTTGSTLTGPTRGGWASGGHGTVKNNTWYFWVRSSEYAASNTSYASPVAYTPPFLPTDLTISRNTSEHANSSSTEPDITTSNGLWTYYIDSSSITGTYNNYAPVRNGNVLPDTSGDKITSGVNGYTINNTNASNTPSSGITQYYIWGSRTKTTGGNGGQGFPGGWQQTNLSFFVENGISPTVTNSSGSWFDATSSAVDSSNTDNALRTRASFTGLSTSRYYVIARQDSGGNWETARAWWSGSASIAQTFTDPLANIDTQRTYKLYSNTSQSLTGANEDASFTRTRIDPVVTEPSGITVGSNISSYEVTLTGTVAGLTYYIKDGDGTSPNTGGSATATNTTTNITVSNHCLPGTSNGSTTTAYVWVKSPLNWYSTTSYPTGDSFIVTRSTSSGGSGGSVSQNSSDFGLIVWAQNGTDRLVDTTSRYGRIIASSATNGVLGSGNADSTNSTYNALHQAHGHESWVWNYVSGHSRWKYGTTDVTGISRYSAYVSVPGMTNDPSTWQVIVEVEAYILGNAEYNKVSHRLHLENNRFRIENIGNLRPQDQSLVKHKYHYIVVRSR